MLVTRLFLTVWDEPGSYGEKGERRGAGEREEAGRGLAGLVHSCCSVRSHVRRGAGRGRAGLGCGRHCGEAAASAAAAAGAALAAGALCSPPPAPRSPAQPGSPALFSSRVASPVEDGLPVAGS